VRTTVIADSLGKHGLVRREPGQRDRRVKNLVLTPEGIAAKERLVTGLAARMPWRVGLDDNERNCFLTLLRMMVPLFPGHQRGAYHRAYDG
jgi:DNA-binding MarR family transcriptional regulator